jgi:formamidopyrimidine-DNA glycosylase
MNNLTGTTKEWHSIVADRLLNLERELQHTKTMLERLANIVATNPIKTAGDVREPTFLTIAEQARTYLDLILTPEQKAIVVGTKRDEISSRLRGRVICELYKRGVSPNQITIALSKDHNSIYYHLAMAGLVKARDNKQYSKRRASRLAKLKRMTSPQNK